jgi:hypothetical protein
MPKNRVRFSEKEGRCMSAVYLLPPQTSLLSPTVLRFCGERPLDSAAENLLRAVQHRDASNLETTDGLNGGRS